MRIVVGVTTFANSSIQMRRLARSFELARTEVHPECEVLLASVDNRGDAGLAKFAPTTVRLDSQGNVGFAASTNRLMRHAFENLHGHAFICANPDGAFHHLAFLKFIEYHRQFPSSLVEALQFPEEHPKVYDPILFDTPWCSACCLLIPRTVYEAIGAFDSRFFMYLEDVDYSWRARLSGFSTKVCPQALFAHDVFDRKTSPLVEGRYLESGRYLAWKWHNDDFMQHCENILVQKGHVRSRTDLPKLPPERERMPKASAMQVARFDPSFAFAHCRW